MAWGKTPGRWEGRDRLVSMGLHMNRKQRTPAREADAKVHAPAVWRLLRSELPANTPKLARYLIGKTLVHDSPGVHDWTYR